MTLIGELKEKVEAVESDMEKKAIIAQAGMLLTDEELMEVSGGIFMMAEDCAISDGLQGHGSAVKALEVIEDWEPQGAETETFWACRIENCVKIEGFKADPVR